MRQLLLIFLMILPNFFYAQQYSSTDKKAIRYYEKAWEHVRERRFDEAEEQFLLAIDKDPNFAEAHYSLAREIYRVFGYQKEMLYHFEQAIIASPYNPKYNEAYLFLIENKMNQGLYEEVITFSNNYLGNNFRDPGGEIYVQKVLADCEFATIAMQNPLPYNPQAMSAPMNEFHLQYFPVLAGDQKSIIFTAQESPEGRADKPDEDMYIAYWENDNWTEPEEISKNINTIRNEGTCSISADGRMMVFTACERADNFGKCDLYLSTKVGEEWSEPINLGPSVNTAEWESQPSLSADGKTLYFVSGRPGGYGRRDIWVSRMGTDGIWGEAQNLGPTINTAWDELSPFIHVNGQTLYFSSDGHIGLGGYDIFTSEKKEGRWSEPKNMGYPLNTFQDQVGLFITTDGKKGYYSVEEQDLTEAASYLSSILHVFDVPEEAQPEVKSNYISGIVYDAQTQAPLEATIELYDLTANEIKESLNSDAVDGGYLIVLNEGANYGLEVRSQGYAFKSLTFNYELEENPQPLSLDIPLDPITQGTIFRLNNIFFASNSYELEASSKAELDELVKFMQENPTVRGEISGHTDDRGSHEENMTLSLNRAQSVYDYLTQNGIEASRLEFQGYGETQPDVPNDSDENRALNRRIEFKVL